MFCSKCGEKLSSDARFCEKCGKKTGDVADIAAVSISNKCEKFERIAIWAFLLSIAGIILAYASFIMLGFFLILASGIMGVVSLKKMKRTKAKGKGLAITAIAISSSYIALVLISMFILYFPFNL